MGLNYQKNGAQKSCDTLPLNCSFYLLRVLYYQMKLSLNLHTYFLAAGQVNDMQPDSVQPPGLFAVAEGRGELHLPEEGCQQKE